MQRSATSPSIGAGTSSYHEAIGDDESLAIFLQAMGEFDRAFCDAMSVGKDFTIRLEIRGDAGSILHVRVSNDGFKRPKGVKPDPKKADKGNY